jgi:hypothetical protein
MNTNCPLFKIGTCKGYITRECKYKYHKKCKDNFLCSDENCILGHGISFIKRTILININEKHSKVDLFNNSQDKCTVPLVCSKADCKLQHLLEYNDRQNIIYIINTFNSDKEALNYYHKKYENNIVPPKEPIEPDDIITDISNTVKYYSPVSKTKSYADLVKSNIPLNHVDYVNSVNSIVPLNSVNSIVPINSIIPIVPIIPTNSIVPINSIIPNDCITDTMDELIIERKEIKLNTIKIDSIKKQIEELENSLKEYENNIKNSKEKLLTLANKMVEL